MVGPSIVIGVTRPVTTAPAALPPRDLTSRATVTLAITVPPARRREVRRDVTEQGWLKLGEMRQRARHATGRVMFGQPVCRHHMRKSLVGRIGPDVVRPGAPFGHWIGLLSVKRIRDGRLEGLVVGRQRSIFQPAWHPQPPEAVGVHDERPAFAGLIMAGFGAMERRRKFCARSIRCIESGPLTGEFIPPHEFLALAPRTAVRTRRGTVIKDAAIGR